MKSQPEVINIYLRSGKLFFVIFILSLFSLGIFFPFLTGEMTSLQNIPAALTWAIFCFSLITGCGLIFCLIEVKFLFKKPAMAISPLGIEYNYAFFHKSYPFEKIKNFYLYYEYPFGSKQIKYWNLVLVIPKNSEAKTTWGENTTKQGDIIIPISRLKIDKDDLIDILNSHNLKRTEDGKPESIMY